MAKNWKKKDQGIILTAEQKRVVRLLRKKGTFRFVSQEFAKIYPKERILAGNQLDGMELCKAAGID